MFHEVYIYVEGSHILVECATIQLTQEERVAYIRWVMGE